MMDWTDRHCRYFFRLISKRARLYTEMITAPALVHGDVPRHLDFDPAEHPVALQLGGSDPAALAHAARLGERAARAGFDRNGPRACRYTRQVASREQAEESPARSLLRPQAMRRLRLAPARLPRVRQDRMRNSQGDQEPQRA